jgi:hypothetical protein
MKKLQNVLPLLSSNMQIKCASDVLKMKFACEVIDRVACVDQWVGYCRRRGIDRIATFREEREGSILLMA